MGKAAASSRVVLAKAFNANFAAFYDRLGEARTPPSMVYAADEEARAVTE